MDQVTSPAKMEASRAVQLLGWMKTILSVVGLWPLEINDRRFAFSMICMVVHISSEYADLFHFIGSLEHVVSNLTETITYMVATSQLALLRINSRQFREVIYEVQDNFQRESHLTSEERRIFSKYYSKTRLIIQLTVLGELTTAFIYYFAPITNILVTINRNGTTELDLPYHSRTFYDLSNIHLYVLTYAAQLPFTVVMSVGLIGPDCLIVFLTLHVCARLSSLVERINNIRTNRQVCCQEIKEFVRGHIRLIWMAKTLGKASSVLLLTQLFGGMLLICILSYHVLLSAEEGQKSNFVTFTLYVVSVTFFILINCYVGESLIQESDRVHESLSECRWYEMSTEHAKWMVICMARAQQPLVMTAGKFYTFSLGSFTEIIKTSMAYLSVLRNLI
ncbi:odorant receptor 4-like isoform X1 [Neodiprion lecontei]|uniref:Odorant receptor n=1 Tax=Neodiprion lecontei TaxID=441921 RepID=A0ABM3FR34_NEOLC|nr:odorant receptor 4-like isoform X1 [Neodiprion lecontei]